MAGFVVRVAEFVVGGLPTIVIGFVVGGLQ